jgi:mono/diheme cytochrome c family protein
MPRASVAPLIVAAVWCAGCGGAVQVPTEQASMRRAAEVFYQRCSGCHSLDAADAHGSANPANFSSPDRTNGPNFNVRPVTRRDALYAIRNGGFSGTIMPANIVTGPQAKRVAAFVAKYSGRDSGNDDVVESGEQAP